MLFKKASLHIETASIIIFSKKVELLIGEYCYCWPLKESGKKVADQGKVSEKSGNLDMDSEWQPCYSSHWLTMGKEEIDNFFCLIGDIWIFFLQKYLVSSPLRFI